MDAFVTLISSTTFINNVILLTFLLIFTVLFGIESHNPKSHVDWLDLIIDPGTKKISITKMGQMVGVAGSTWVIITLSQIKEAYTMFPMIFPMWLAFLGGTWSYDKWLKSKQSANSGSNADSGNNTNDNDDFSSRSRRRHKDVENDPDTDQEDPAGSRFPDK